MNGNSKIRLVAAAGATALAALAVSSSSAIAAKPNPACHSAIVSLGTEGADGFGLQLYTHTACGRRVGTPFG